MRVSKERAGKNKEGVGERGEKEMGEWKGNMLERGSESMEGNRPVPEKTGLVKEGKGQGKTGEKVGGRRWNEEMEEGQVKKKVTI